MAELTPEQEEADGGGRAPGRRPVDGPCWTSDHLAISREWVAFKETRKASWQKIPYATVSSVRRGDAGRIVLTRSDGLAVEISASVLDSLEACELLSDGLHTSPAVTPDAASMLQSHLAAARARLDSELARWHTVNRSGTAHSFHSMRGFHIFLGVAVVLLGIGWLAGTIAVVINPSSSWAQGSSPSDAIWAIPVGLLAVWLGIRLLRVGVQISSEKITIRGYLRTRTVSASEIRAITLQPKDNGEGSLRWIPQIELTGGKSFWIYNFDCGPARNPPKPAAAAIIEEIRTLLGVRTPDPGGQPGPVHSDGSERPPLPPADPTSDRAYKGKPPADASSPPPGSAQQRQDAASKARWATICFVILLLATAGGTAVFIAGYNPNADSPTDWTVIFTLGGPFAAWLAWRARKDYMKVDEELKMADELADATDGAASPIDDQGEHPATG